MEEIQENPLLEAETIETISFGGEDGIQAEDLQTIPETKKELGGELENNDKEMIIVPNKLILDWGLVFTAFK